MSPTADLPDGPEAEGPAQKASPAKRAPARKPAAAKAPAARPAAKKVPAKKAAEGDVVAEKAPAKKAPARKAPARKAPARKAQKASAEKAPATRPAAKKSPAAKASPKKAAPSPEGGPTARPPVATSHAEPAGLSRPEPAGLSQPEPAGLSEPEPAGLAQPEPTEPTQNDRAEQPSAPPAREKSRKPGRFRRAEVVSRPTTSSIPKSPSRDPRRIQQRVAVVIPAKDEARRIAATVRSAKSIPQVDLVLVVDDGSEDNTQHIARDAGAVVVRHSHNRGKAAAMETGAAVVAMRDTPERPPRLLLFIDADLGETAVNTAPLIPPVAEHAADFSIALLPPQKGAGGRGMVVAAARKGIARLTGWAPTQPLSGMRCLTRAAFEAATPLARGWGVETGMTIDLLRQGYVAVEVPCDLRHRASGNDLGGQLHRAAQYRDVKLAISARQVRGAAGALKRAVTPKGLAQP